MQRFLNALTLILSLFLYHFVVQNFSLTLFYLYLHFNIVMIALNNNVVHLHVYIYKCISSSLPILFHSMLSRFLSKIIFFNSSFIYNAWIVNLGMWKILLICLLAFLVYEKSVVIPKFFSYELIFVFNLMGFKTVSFSVSLFLTVISFIYPVCILFIFS